MGKLLWVIVQWEWERWVWFEFKIFMVLENWISIVFFFFLIQDRNSTLT